MIWIAIGIIIAGYLIAKAIERSNALKQGELEEAKKLKQEEAEEARNKTYQEESEKGFREKYQGKYPHLVGKIENSWLEVFGGEPYLKMSVSHPQLRAAQMMYIKADNNTKQDNEVDFILCDLWDLTNILLEHLEKYHESNEYEYEIAIVMYWQLVVTEAESFTGENDVEVIRRKFQSPPYTDLQEIVSWFPKKKNHPKSEIKFNFIYVNKKPGPLPRKTKFPDFIDKKLKDTTKNAI
jgi:hypothetical protein